MREGIAQGLEQGLQRGIALVLRQLNRRLGGLEAALAERVRQLPIDQVEDLGEEALLDFDSEEDLQRWLAQTMPE